MGQGEVESTRRGAKGSGFPGSKEDIYTSGKGKEKRYFFNKTDLYTCGGIQKEYMFNYWWIFNFSKIIAMMHWIH